MPEKVYFQPESKTEAARAPTAPASSQPREMKPVPTGSFFRGMLIWSAVSLPVWVWIIWKFF